MPPKEVKMNFSTCAQGDMLFVVGGGSEDSKYNQNFIMKYCPKAPESQLTESDDWRYIEIPCLH